MICKTLEIRDEGTHIPALAIKLAPANDAQRYQLWRGGYAIGEGDALPILLMKLADRATKAYPAAWGSGRTLREAHGWIEEHFDELQDGDVVDVRFILGETAAPAPSEREA